MRLTVLMCVGVCALAFVEVVSGATILDLTFDETGNPQAVGSYSPGANDAVLGTDATVEATLDPTGRVDIGSVTGTTPAVLDYAGNRVMQFQGDAGGDNPQMRTDVSTDDFNFSGNKFTIQMWLNVDDMNEIRGNGVRLVERNTSANHWALMLGGFRREVSFSYVPQGESRTKFATTNDLFGSVETGVWKHVAFTFDADNDDVHFYYNGVDQALTAALPGDVLPIKAVGATYATIGSSRQWVRAFRGYMDEVRIDDRVIAPGDAAFGYTNRIPEPATLALLGVGSVTLVQWRRARR